MNKHTDDGDSLWNNDQITINSKTSLSGETQNTGDYNLEFM